MQADDRFSGYLSDTTYPDRFHRELSPAWLSYVAVQGGAPARALGEPFTYLDLGCGFAHSTVVNAGAFPRAEFHACDFNPAHIEAAARHAAHLGVENLHLHQAFFEDLLARDLPPFDFIVLHGIYSWVSPQVRGTIQEIIARKLKAGGLAYLSYNCLPGWAAESPLRRLMLELAAAETGGTGARARLALGAMQQLSNTAFRYFRDNPGTTAAVDSLTRDPANYLAHEFLNEAWTLYYSIDVADDMARAGATYLGSATLADNHPVLVMDKPAAEAIARLPTARLQQLAFDFAVNQRFRRDVFLVGERPAPTPAEALRALDDVVIGCLTDVDQIGAQAVIPRGKMTLQDSFITALRALMRRGSMTIGDVVAALGGPGRNPIEIRQNLLFLVAAGTLAPFAQARTCEEDAPPPRAAAQVVRNALTRIVETGAPAVVPCELAGNGVLVGPEEARQATSWLSGGESAAPPPSRLVRLGLLAPSPQPP